MKKVTLLFAGCATVAALSLAACSDNNQSPTTDSNTAPMAQQENSTDNISTNSAAAPASQTSTSATIDNSMPGTSGSSNTDNSTSNQAQSTGSNY